MFTLFLIALFLPPALIPQFQLILRLGLYNNPIGYVSCSWSTRSASSSWSTTSGRSPRSSTRPPRSRGAGYLRFVLQIIMPLAKPAIATVAVLHAIGVWNELILPTIYLTSEEFYPVTRGLIVFHGIYGNDWPLLAAAC